MSRCADQAPDGKIAHSHAGVAQLVEHILAKDKVDGSNPFARSRFAGPPNPGALSFQGAIVSRESSSART